MDKDNIKLLKDIMTTPSPSSREDALRDLYVKYFDGRADSVGKDVLGNASVQILGKINGPVVMLTSHMDEIAFVVTGYHEEGFLRFSSIGGVDACLLPGTCVDVLTDKGVITGIFGRRPIHEQADVESVGDMDSMYIDIGAHSESDAKKMAKVGDMAVWKPVFYKVGRGIIAARGVDDKIGVYIMMRVLDELISARQKDKLSSTVFGVLSSMEELIGSNSALCAANKIKPGIAIIIETHETSDYPDSTTKERNDATIGGGPVLDVGVFTNRKLNNFILSSAQKLGISIQTFFSDIETCTTLDEIRSSAGGVACSLISIPIRYLHAPQSLFSLNVIEDTIALLVFICTNLYTVDTFVS